MKQRIKVYGEADLMADIGGLLGLFLGDPGPPEANRTVRTFQIVYVLF